MDDSSLFSALADTLDVVDEFEKPGDLAKALYPPTVSTPALELIDEELVAAVEAAEAGESPRLMIFMPPQEGKSERVSHYFPLWLLRRNHDLRIAIVSYDKSTAERWGRDLRNDINNFDGSEDQIDLGLRLRTGSKSAGRWQLDDHRGGVYCVGIGGALTGRAVDVMIIDDPVKNAQEADSEATREMHKAWWESTGATRLSPNALVIVIQTRWHEDDLSGWILQQAALDPAKPQWKVVNIPAQAERLTDDYGNPLPGIRPDALGREEGEWMVSARGRTVEQWERRRAEVGHRVWAALFQQRPAPDQGNIFMRKWWNYFDQPRARRRPNGSYAALLPGALIQVWDMTFKDTDRSDYVVGMVLQKCGAEVYVLDLMRAKMDLVGTEQAMLQLSAKWPQARLKLVEDKANGPGVMSRLNKQIGGIVAWTPTGSKLARAYAAAPFCEARNIWLPSPELSPWVSEFVNELATFPNGANDDIVDAFTMGISRLLLEGGSTTSYMDQLLRERGISIVKRED